MKKLNKYLFVSLLISFTPLSVISQQINSLYFIENVPVRHMLNPAFQPYDDFYISLPIIGFSQFNIGNNSVTFKDIIYKQNGQTVTFLHDRAGTDKFYNALNQNTVIRTDLQTNILSFGFKANSICWNFSLNEKFEGMIGVPKDFFQLLLFGTPQILNNSYNLTTLQSDFTLYTEAAFGFSKQLNDRLTLGAKVKMLVGSANLSNTNSGINLNAGLDKLSLVGQGSINESSPVQVNFPNFQSLIFIAPTGTSNWLKPSGFGAGIDVGVDYRLTKKINISAAILDLGFINWTKNVRNINYGFDYKFDGLGQFSSNQNISTLKDIYNHFLVSNSLIDSVTNAFNQSVTVTQSTNSYLTGTTAKLNLGFEYKMLNDKLSAGLLSRTQLFKKTITEEVTTSVNVRPAKWFNATLSYSVMNGNGSSVGAGIGLTTGIFQWFVSADYIPFQKVDVPLSDINSNLPNFKVPIPYNSEVFNLSLGMNLVFNAHEKENKKEKVERVYEAAGLKNANKKSNSNINSTKSKSNTYRSKTNNRKLNSKSGLHNTNPTNDCRCDWN